MAFAAAIPMWLQVAAVAVSAMAAYQQGQAAKRAGEYNAAVAAQNAKIARDQASARAKQQDRLNRMRLGTIRASQGASGGTQEGSVLDVLGDAAVQGELERQNILYQGEIEATSHEHRRNLALMSAEDADRSSKIGAASAVLGGASSTFGAASRLTRTA